MIDGWNKAHGKCGVPKLILPKCGVVCEIDSIPSAAIFLHMDNSCGLCLIDHAVSRPGLSFAKSKVAFQHCMECLKKVAREFGYHTVSVFTYPAIARVLKKQGFIAAESGLVQLFSTTQEAS